MSEPRLRAARPVVSILVVSWRVRDLLRECLRSLQRESSWPSHDCEVLVVDNASGDGTVEMLRAEFPTVRVLANAENRGFAPANNQAFAQCAGEWVILLNPDTELSGRALEKMLEYLAGHPDVAVAGCRLLNSDGSLQRWTGGAFPTLGNVAAHYLFLQRILPARLRPRALYLERQPDRPIDVDWVSGACMAIRREALEGRLFAAESFMYGEDMELCARLQRAGWRVVYLPEPAVVHHQGASMRQQTGAIVLAAFKGPRDFWRVQHGGRGLWLYDTLTVTGFLLRTVGYAVLAALRPGRGFAPRAAQSARYTGRAWRVMLGL